MLKTNRIIPLVFILFFFGFTLFTVAPVFAQDPMLEERIRNIEEAICEANTARGTLNRNTGVYTPHLFDEVCRDIDSKKFEQRHLSPTKSRHRKNWDKDPYTYFPDGSSQKSQRGKFRCSGFPEIRENPNEPKGVAYAKCKQKFGEARGNTAPPPPKKFGEATGNTAPPPPKKFGEATGNTAPPPPKKFFCAQFPEALNYQECMKKIQIKVMECKRKRIPKHLCMQRR